MKRLSARTSILLLAAFLAGACAGMPRPDAVGAAGTGPGAALARLTVENQTGFKLAIGYRRATPPHTEIIVGRIGPEASGRTAPIPAGEPIILVARNAAGAVYTLPLRSFNEGEDWTWSIGGGARFVTERADAGASSAADNSESATSSAMDISDTATSPATDKPDSATSPATDKPDSATSPATDKPDNAPKFG